MTVQFIDADGAHTTTAQLDWSKGLLPAIVQDASNHRVLMLGFVNQAALDHTLTSGQMTFYSRSKQRLWTKGESSGNFLQVREIRVDCDRDTLLVSALPLGPSCHRGTISCFHDAPSDMVGSLNEVIKDRSQHPQDGSYTNSLFTQGATRIAQKVGEEGVEVALAGVTGSNDELTSESADLIYHLLVLLRQRGLDWQDVQTLLSQRHTK